MDIRKVKINGIERTAVYKNNKIEMILNEQESKEVQYLILHGPEQTFYNNFNNLI